MATFINILAANCFFDPTGNPIAAGTLTVTPSSKFRLGGGGQALGEPVSRPIVNGSMVGTLQLADPSQTSPISIGYTFAVQDHATFHGDTWANVLIAPDGDGNFDLSQLNTGQWVPAVPQTIVSSSGGSGSAAENTLTMTTASVISQYQVAASVSGQAVIASAGNPAHMGHVVGIATSSVQADQALEVQFTGTMTNPNWTFADGPVWLSPTGSITQTPPTSGFLQLLGTISGTTLLISVQEPISL